MHGQYLSVRRYRQTPDHKQVKPTQKHEHLTYCMSGLKICRFSLPKTIANAIMINRFLSANRYKDNKSYLN